MNFRAAFEKGARILEKELISELDKQGHRNTGKLEGSFTYMFGNEGKSQVLEGYAYDYAQILDKGYGRGSVNWGQLPFLIEYFKTKGLSDKEAKQAGAATITVWMKEGVPTRSSARFSSTGKRLGFIDIVNKVISDKVNDAVLNDIDKEVDILFRKTKSETI